jgi:hypothetical protein
MDELTEASIVKRAGRKMRITERQLRQVKSSEEILRSLIREMAVFDPGTTPEGQDSGRIFRIAADMCRELGDRQILIREFQSSAARGYHYVTTEGIAERGRMALRYKQEPVYREFIDGLASRWGLSSVVYCASIGGRAAPGMFGREHIVLPAEPYKVIWSEEVGDSGSWLNGELVGTLRVPRASEEVPAAIESYTEGWPPNNMKLEEVILDTESYYLIGREWAADTFQQMTRFTRRPPPRAAGPVVSSKKREEEEIMKKYGVKGPTREYKASLKDEMMAARTYSELLPYFEWMLEVSRG